MPKESIITFDVEKCVACHACVVACKAWRSLELGHYYRRVRRIWSGSFPAVRLAHVSVNCQHCLEPACVQACPVGAIEKSTEDGRVLVDKDACIACGVCHDACPYHVPSYTADGYMEKCDLCTGQGTSDEEPPCIATCPTQALKLENLDAAAKSTCEAKMLELVRLADNGPAGN